MVVTDGPRRAKLSSFPSIDSPYTFLSSYVSYPDSVGSHFAGTVSGSSQIAKLHGGAGQASCALSRDASYVGRVRSRRSLCNENLCHLRQRMLIDHQVHVAFQFLVIFYLQICDVRRIDVCEHPVNYFTWSHPVLTRSFPKKNASNRRVAVSQIEDRIPFTFHAFRPPRRDSGEGGCA